MEIEIKCIMPLSSGAKTYGLELVGTKEQVLVKAIRWLETLKDNK